MTVCLQRLGLMLGHRGGPEGPLPTRRVGVWHLPALAREDCDCAHSVMGTGQTFTEGIQSKHERNARPSCLSILVPLVQSGGLRKRTHVAQPEAARSRGGFRISGLCNTDRTDEIPAKGS